MTTEAKNMIGRLTAKHEQRSNIERNDPIFKDAIKTIEKLLEQQEALTETLERAVKIAKFENHAPRPWHADAQAIIEDVRKP